MEEKKIWIYIFIFILLFQGCLIYQTNNTSADIINRTFFQNDNFIRIEGDLELSVSDDVSSGSGTLNDPFIITDKTIHVKNISGIFIANTTSYLNINNCTLYGGLTNDTSSIYIQNSNNINISSSRIYLGNQCLFIESSSNIMLKDLKINNSNLGIMIHYGENIIIQDNIIHNCIKDGIKINGITNKLNITNNIIKYGQLNGLSLNDRLYYLNISNNMISSNRECGIENLETRGNNNSISFNHISENQKHGLNHSGENYIINRNNISFNNASGIALSNRADYNIIINNDINNNMQDGINLNHCHYNSITNNNISNNSDGIYNYYSYDNIFFNNRIISNENTGINITKRSHNNEINMNIIKDNGLNGIVIKEESWYTIIFNNTLENNHIYGIYSNSTGFGIIIKNNSFLGGEKYLVSLNKIRDYIIIAHNYFYGPSMNTAIKFENCKGVNVWNNLFQNPSIVFNNQILGEIKWNIENKTYSKNIMGGNYTYGNYWSNYNGDDIDGDGIGDTDLPHGPGDEGPLVKDVPIPDMIPPSIIDITGAKPKTRELFEASLRVLDNRNIFGMEYDVNLSVYTEPRGWGEEKKPKDHAMDEYGIINLSTHIDERAMFLLLNITLKDFSGNIAIIPINYTVVDTILPWIKDSYWEDEARTGENFTITFHLEDNIGINRSYIEFYYENNEEEMMRNYSYPGSSGASSPAFIIPIEEKVNQITFRIVIHDINDLESVSEWYSVNVIDAIPPTIEDLTTVLPRSNMDYNMKFKIYDNMGVDSILIEATFDIHTYFETKESKNDFGPFKDIWEVSIPVPKTSYSMTYEVTIRDEQLNEYSLINELEVIDSVHPEIMDRTIKSPKTDNSFVLKFLISDNEGVSDGFFEYWYDNGSHINTSGIIDRFRIDHIPSSALMLNYRNGVMDIDGNWMIIRENKPILDGTPPSIDLQYGIPFTSQIFKVWVNAIDNRNIWKTSLMYTLNDDLSQLPAQFPGQYFEIEIPSDAFKITLYGIAIDSNNNENETIVEIEVLDGSPPVLEFQEIIIGSDGMIRVSFKCEDNSEIENVWIILVGENGDTFNVTEGINIGNDYLIPFNKKGLGNEFNHSIFAMDVYGNVASTEERTFIIPGKENGLSSGLWMVLFLVIISIISVVAIGGIIIIRSRSKSSVKHDDLMKLKEVLNHFEVGTNIADMDCYKILGVTPNATNQQISRRYRELALIHHPDKSVKGSTADDRNMKSINCAKTILLDPEKRTILDHYLGLK